MDEDRRAMGWVVPEFGDVTVRVLRSAADARTAVREAPPDTVHVFSGMYAYPLVSAGFREACRLGRTVGLMVESNTFLGWRGIPRIARTAVYGQVFGRRISFILAMGSLGVRWYRSAGFPPSRLFPYGYFVDPAPSESSAPRNPKAPVRLAFVGKFLPYKGPDLLFRALARQPKSSAWGLDVVGDGPLRAACEAKARKAGFQDRITFHGVLPYAKALQRIADADVLVAPSRWDGWGVVINEALLRGVRVVCGSNCGAADLIVTPAQGVVVRSGSVAALSTALARVVAEGPQSEDSRATLRLWAQRLDGNSAARYLCEVVAAAAANSGRPTPPWLDRR